MRLSARNVLALATAIIINGRNAAAQFPRVRDSVGIHIVENSARAKAPTVFILAEPPVFDLGGLKQNPDDELNSLNGYDSRDLRLSTGEHVVIDRNKVRFFDAAGKQLKVAGREGEGPHEFRAITSICRTRGDTLVVADGSNARVSILDRTGRFVREFTVGPADVTQDACFDDGTFIVREYHRSAGPAWSPMHVVRRRLDGTVVGVLGDFWPGVFNVYMTPRVDVTVSGNRFFVGDPRASEVKGYDVDGKLVAIIRTSDPIEKVTAAEAAAMTPMAAGAGSGAGRENTFPKPTEWPSYARIFTDPAGRLWVQDTPKSRTDPLLWTAFDRDGMMLGKFLMSASVTRADPRLVSFTEDGVQIRREDSDGALHLTTYRFGRQ